MTSQIAKFRPQNRKLDFHRCHRNCVYAVYWIYTILVLCLLNGRRWLTLVGTLRTLVKMLASEPGNHNSGEKERDFQSTVCPSLRVFVLVGPICDNVHDTLTSCFLIRSQESRNLQQEKWQFGDHDADHLINKKVMTYKMTMQGLILFKIK